MLEVYRGFKSLPKHDDNVLLWTTAYTGSSPSTSLSPERVRPLFFFVSKLPLKSPAIACARRTLKCGEPEHVDVAQLYSVGKGYLMLKVHKMAVQQ